MIKAIIFDLDGVLIDLKDAHFECLNKALSYFDDKYIISKKDHYLKFDGLPTKQKLKILTEERGLSEEFHKNISEFKQEITLNYIRKNVEKDKDQIEILKVLKSLGYKLLVASNSVRNTIYSVLVKKGIIQYFDYIFSNQDVNFSKPNPEIYLKAIAKLGLKPKECLILEDSPFGIEAAQNSGAHILKIKNSKDVTLSNINSKIMEIDSSNKKEIWDGNKNWTILIPMAGKGSRFANANYIFPKPLIEVNQKPMIQIVVENLGINAHFVYIVQKSHYENYNLKYLLNLITPNCDIIQVDGITEGAACTTLLAKDLINNDKHLLIANSDQFIEWDANRFYYSVEDEEVDGGILTFNSCFGYRTLIETKEYGKIPIGKIVNQKLQCNVLSYNEKTNNFEYCKIKNYFKSDGTVRKWVKLNTPWRGITKVTNDHEFLTKKGWKKIEEIKTNDLFLTDKNCMNNKQYEVFVGTMLGDGFISSLKNGIINSGLKFTHSKKQKEWCITKLNIFSNLGIKFNEVLVFGKYPSVSCRVKVNEEFKKERIRWYKEKKIVPKDIQLTPLTIATWYMDDGHLLKKQNVGRFSTDNFDDESIEILRENLKQNYNIKTNLGKNKRIIIKAESREIFFDLISKYIIPEMSYKLPENYRRFCSYKEWNMSEISKYYYENNIILNKIDLDELKSDTKYAFCLETENKNFVVDGLIAHNCHSKWSYAKLNEEGYVTEVAEKKPISKHATVGIYYWNKGSEYVKYAEQMIQKKIKVNNEFYVCPVYNEAIQDNKKIKIYNIERMWGLGDPSSLEIFLKDYNDKM